MFSSPDASWPPGTLLAGRFRVERELGRGGWGVVLAVVDQADRPLALKLLLHDASEEALRRFAREAEVIRSLRSAHVCRIHDTGTLDDGSPFIVMDRLVGEDLDDLIRRLGPLPIATAVDFILQACDAIAEAHLDGVVHRDIKPSNLFLARAADGSSWVKVLDFGIAKARRTDLKSLTGSGAVLGSPHYMPPEQLVSSRDVDRRADIWALGVTLFELLTGAVCFRGKDVSELFAAVLRDEPIPLEQLRPDAPPELAAVIRRCLHKDPEDRFDEVVDLANALAPFATDAGRLIAQRIGGLTERLATGPTQLGDQTGLAHAPTQAGVAPTLAAPAPTLATTSPPGAASWPGHHVAPTSSSPGQGHGPVAPPYQLAPAVPASASRKRAILVVALVAVTTMVGAIVVTIISLSLARNATKPTLTRPIAPPAPSGGCHWDDCDLRLEANGPTDPFSYFDDARKLAQTRVPGGTLRMIMIASSPTWSWVDGHANLTFTLQNERKAVYVTVASGGTRLTDAAKSDHPPISLSRLCPYDRVASIARRRHPDAAPSTIQLLNPNFGPGTSWFLTGNGWQMQFGPDCKITHEQ